MSKNLRFGQFWKFWKSNFFFSLIKGKLDAKSDRNTTINFREKIVTDEHGLTVVNQSDQSPKSVDQKKGQPGDHLSGTRWCHRYEMLEWESAHAKMRQNNQHQYI